MVEPLVSCMQQEKRTHIFFVQTANTWERLNKRPRSTVYLSYAPNTTTLGGWREEKGETAGQILHMSQLVRMIEAKLATGFKVLAHY